MLADLAGEFHHGFLGILGFARFTRRNRRGHHAFAHILRAADRAFDQSLSGLNIKVIRIAEPGLELVRAVTDEGVSDHGFYMGTIVLNAK
jgi:hypothetical protein